MNVDAASSCKQFDPETWFPVGVSDSARAVADQAAAICRECPARSGCARAARDLKIQHGVWAGIWIDDPEVSVKAKRTALDLIAEGIEPGELRRRRISGPVAVCLGTCGRMTRPQHSSKATHPGTVPRVLKGKCRPCSNNRQAPLTDVEREDRRQQVADMSQRNLPTHVIADRLGVDSRTVQRDRAVMA